MPFFLPTVLAVAAIAAEEESASVSSHDRMVAVLADIVRRTPTENPWHGLGRATELRQALEELPANAGSRRWKLCRRLGRQELRLGNTARAIELHEEARRLLPQLTSITPAEWRHTQFELAIAYLREAENRNCVSEHATESCLFPIQASGVHQHPTSARQAAACLTEILKRIPDDLAARWLLNIAHMTLGEYPDGVPKRHLIPPERFDSRGEFPAFPDIAPQLGLNTFSLSGGATFEDFDNDHDLDFLTSTFDPAGQVRYFRNEGEQGFRERTEEAGLIGILGGLNLIQGDYDNDGFVDVLILRGAWLGKAGGHPNSLLRNQGDGTFQDVTFDAGLGESHHPTQTAAFADIDNDGDLDLYIGNENSGERGDACQLFENLGDGTFRDIAKQAGVENLGFTKGVCFGDYDNDGDPDLYVSNQGENNRLYRNEGNRKFQDVAPKLGVTGPVRSFPVWFWDYDNDGHLDLFVSTYWQVLSSVAESYLGLPTDAEPHGLYHNDGKGGFENRALRSGLTLRTAPMGANFGDLNYDGYPDFYLGTGYPRYEGLMPNVLYMNDEGQGFRDVSAAARVGHLQKGHAVVFADFDQDGDQDLFHQLGGAFPGDGYTDVLFQNPGFGNHFLVVKLHGTRTNRSAIGARVAVTVDSGASRRTIQSRVNSGGSFGANPLRCEIGLGKADRIVALEVHWPTSQTTQVFSEVPLDSFLEVTEGQSELKILE